MKTDANFRMTKLDKIQLTNAWNNPRRVGLHEQLIVAQVEYEQWKKRSFSNKVEKND